MRYNPPVLTAPIELLAPAGDFACLEAALDAGADAVYLGLTSLNVVGGTAHSPAKANRLASVSTQPRGRSAEATPTALKHAAMWAMYAAGATATNAGAVKGG